MTLNTTTIITTILSFLTLNFVFEQILDYLNLKSSKKEVPKELSDIYDNAEYQKSQNYNIANSRLSFITSTLSFISYFIVIITGFLGFWDNFLAQFISVEVIRALTFFLSLYIISDLFTIPFQYYSTFVIEEKFGFNKSSVKLFFVDKLKQRNHTPIYPVKRSYKCYTKSS